MNLDQTFLYVRVVGKVLKHHDDHLKLLLLLIIDLDIALTTNFHLIGRLVLRWLGLLGRYNFSHVLGGNFLWRRLRCILFSTVCDLDELLKLLDKEHLSITLFSVLAS